MQTFYRVGVNVHPLWRPFEILTPTQVSRARVGQRQVAVSAVLAPADWTDAFSEVQATLWRTLGDRALSVEHVGSTSIPGIWAKPILDVDLTVADSGLEDCYVEDLQRAGFHLIVREPEWEEHRCFTFARPNSNVHVFSSAAIEPQRHMLFRDWLTVHADDRTRYERVKRSLAEQGFDPNVDYNAAKAAVIYDIYERIFASDLRHPHHPQPRPGRSAEIAI